MPRTINKREGERAETGEQGCCHKTDNHRQGWARMMQYFDLSPDVGIGIHRHVGDPSVKISMKPLRHPPGGAEGAGTKLGTNSDKITTVYCWCVGLFFAKFWQAAFKLRLLIFGPHLKSWEYLLFDPSLNTYRTNPPLSQNSNKAWLSFFLKAKSNKAEELNALTGIKSPIDSARWDVSHWKIFLLNFLTCKIWVWWLT